MGAERVRNRLRSRESEPGRIKALNGSGVGSTSAKYSGVEESPTVRTGMAVPVLRTAERGSSRDSGTVEAGDVGLSGVLDTVWFPGGRTLVEMEEAEVVVVEEIVVVWVAVLVVVVVVVVACVAGVH